MKEKIKIAIQGGPASFHDLAAQKYFSHFEVQIKPCRSFRETCIKLVNKKVNYTVMAVENTLVGSILPNYSLLEEYPLYIIGEVYLHIHQHLMALPGQKIEDVKNVRSHPMALLQCSEFLEKYEHLLGIETNDTADSAKEIQNKQQRGIAAIASKSAADLYNLEILAYDIENLKQNYTRFIILSNKKDDSKNNVNKASINFRLDHRPGALANILNIFMDYGINLSLIQSIPIIGKIQEYAFHLDIEWQEDESLNSCIPEIIHNTKGFKFIGKYKSGIISEIY